MVTFESASPRWLDFNDPELVTGKAHIIKPYSGTDPFPAVIMLHTSMGLGSGEWSFAEELRSNGFAVMLVDSFSPRLVGKITDDQTKVSEASILYDLYRAYEVLKARPDIDESRVAVLGFSKGALPALYSMLNEINTRYGYEESPFRAHAAFYPWCGLRFNDMGASGAPLQLHIGSMDEVMPYKLCIDLVQKMKTATPAMKGQVFVYKGARHAFDHPHLPNLPFLQVDYKVPKRCFVEQGADGAFTERHSGIVVTGETFSQAINACSFKGARVAGDKESGALSHQRTVDFLKVHLAEKL